MALTLEEIKDLLLFCKQNGIPYIETADLKAQILMDPPAGSQPIYNDPLAQLNITRE